MKKLLASILSLSLIVTALAGCSSSASSSEITSTTSGTSSTANSAAPLSNTIYRGQVTEVTDKQVTVAQVDGYNYGQASIIFNIDDATKITDNGLTLAKDAFVEITYNGVLTRSMPAQGTAETINIVSSFSDGIVINGTIEQVVEEDGVYALSIVPIGSEVEETISEVTSSGVVDDDYLYSDNIVVVYATADVLENISTDKLVSGTMVSIVTNGVAALSLPAQMTAIAVLPYTN